LFKWLYRLSDLARHRARRKRWNPERATGRRGEDVAHRYLQSKGLTIVARNYRTPSGSGELDLVARSGDALIVVEVKSRSNKDFGPPERNLDLDQQHRIMRGAQDYARRAGVELINMRFDVVTVVFSTPVEVRHFTDVFHPIEDY